MAHHFNTGAASAAPTRTSYADAARAFLAIGGRLMVGPFGYESAIDHGLLFEPVPATPQEADACAARRSIVSRFIRAERAGRRNMAALARRHGDSTPNGWLVWKEGQA